MTTALKTRKPLAEIQQAAIYRCTDKQTNEVFYMIKSDSDENTWYELHFDHTRLAWTCTCPSAKPCKHERALQQVLAIRRERIATAMGPEALASVKHAQAEEDRKLASRTFCTPRVLTEAEETAAAYYRMSFQEY